MTTQNSKQLFADHPEPWTFNKTAHDGWVIKDSSRFHIIGTFEDDPSLELLQAFAAVPELISACESAMEAMSGGSISILEAHDRCAQALKKALNEP